jgi:hypothetical protein
MGREYKKGKESHLFIDLSDSRFGKLVAQKYVEYTTKKGNVGYRWLCHCDCGNEAHVRTNYLTKGIQQQCKKCAVAIAAKLRTKPNNESLLNRAFRNYQRGAKDRDYTFELSYNDFLQLINDNCHYCGSEPKVHKGEVRYMNGETFKRNGIDRIDSKIGYNLDNCITSCERCNVAKMSMTYDEFINMIRNIFIHLRLEKPSTTIPTGSTEQANGSGNTINPDL